MDNIERWNKSRENEDHLNFGPQFNHGLAAATAWLPAGAKLQRKLVKHFSLDGNYFEVG